MTLARDQKTEFKPQTRRGLRQKRVRSPKPAEDCIKNRFGAQNLPRFAQKIDFEPKTRRVSRQKQDFAPKRGTFHWFRVHVGLDRGSKRRFRVHVPPHKNTPGDHVALTLHGRPVTQTRNQRIMELKEFVTAVLQQITDGVVDAQKRGVFVNPRKKHHGVKPNSYHTIDGENYEESLQTVDFEVGLTNEVGSGGGKIGVSWGGFSLGADGGGKTSNSSVTRIRFSIPMLLSVYKSHEKD